MNSTPAFVPAAACSRKTCEGCEINGKLICVHTKKDLLKFWGLFMIVAIPFFTGMILGKHWLGLGVWAGLAILFFGYVEALILCRHCPHYAEDGFLLKCHANAGLPKIPAFDPRPLNKVEKTVWLVYAAVIIFWFVPFFIIGQQWVLLAVTSGAGIAFFTGLQLTKCNRCYNLSCPINRVPADVRAKFFDNYPIFAEAWGIKSNE